MITHVAPSDFLWKTNSTTHTNKDPSAAFFGLTVNQPPVPTPAFQERPRVSANDLMSLYSPQSTYTYPQAQVMPGYGMPPGTVQPPAPVAFMTPGSGYSTVGYAGLAPAPTSTPFMQSPLSFFGSPSPSTVGSSPFPGFSAPQTGVAQINQFNQSSFFK